MGIAFYRLLCIKYPTTIKGVEVRTALVICTSCLIPTFGAAFIHFLSPIRHRTTGDLCLGISPEMKSVLYDYVAPNQAPRVAYVVIALGFLVLLGQFCIYMSICVFLYCQDQSVKQMIPNNSFRKRNRRNALDLISHMLSFSLDNIFLILAFLTDNKFESDMVKLSLLTLALSKYGINGFFQLLRSKPLKGELLKVLDSLLLIPTLSKLVGFFSFIGLLPQNRVQLIRIRYMSR